MIGVTFSIVEWIKQERIAYHKQAKLTAKKATAQFENQKAKEDALIKINEDLLVQITEYKSKQLQ